MKSSEEEVKVANRLVADTSAEIADLKSRGKKVHIIWDFDFVLCSGLSDDVFSLVGGDLAKYFEYEARLSLSVSKPGIWLPLAERVGELHSSQDIVTARSSFLAFRVMMFCMWFAKDTFRWVRWILYIGHQSKSDSFRIILDSFKKDPDTVVYLVDDNPKHVDAFNRLSADSGMSDRTKGIVSPKIRSYDEEQLAMHYDRVMNAKGGVPEVIPGYPGGYADGFIVMPDGIQGFKNICVDSFLGSERTAAIDKFGTTLEITHQHLFPGQPVTPEGLHFAYKFLQEEGRHDTMMINELMEEAMLRESREGQK